VSNFSYILVEGHCVGGVETRGNLYKLVPDCSKYELRRHYFSLRIVSVWNSLPDSVVSAESVNSFKSRLDKFWLHDFDWSQSTCCLKLSV